MCISYNWIWTSNGGNYEVTTTFWNVTPRREVCKLRLLLTGYLPGLLFDPKDGGGTFLWNVGQLLPALYGVTQNSSHLFIKYRLIPEQWSKMGVEGKGRSQLELSQHLTGRTEENQKMLQAKIWTPGLPNMKQACQPLDRDAGSAVDPRSSRTSDTAGHKVAGFHSLPRPWLRRSGSLLKVGESRRIVHRTTSGRRYWKCTGRKYSTIVWFLGYSTTVSI
jgi:hypothetical protein